ncbi:hypothetical protein FQR65_LT04410 [Abscondita terminalis]|nr:hypothetical protein FQR65_LT04410 [Abscondita terminalis]
MPSYFIYLISLYLTLHFPIALTTSVQQQIVTFDLSPSNEDNINQTLFIRQLNLTEGNVSVNVLNVPSSIGFFVIQAHSFPQDIVLRTSVESVKGTNIGLVEDDLTSNAVYRYEINTVLVQNVEVLLAVVLYTKTDPIPGGCNMVYNTRNAPYQIVTYDDNMVKVDASPAKGKSCDITALPRLDMYHLYLEEQTLDNSSYFYGIENLLTVKNIKKYGTKVDSVKHLPLRRYYSAYRGTGSIFAIIATNANGSSAYIPAVSYACDIADWGENCLGPVSIIWKVLCAVIFFIGTFICFFGHRFFRMTMFIFGFIFGSFIFYIVANIGNMVVLDLESVGYALLFGCAYGITWLLLWRRYGIPILTVSLPVTFVGYITVCVIFYTGVADFRIFQNDLNYWGVVFCVILPITISLLFFTEFASILACSVVGATAIIISIDHYIGGSIHYIILTNVRRAIISNFNLAILNPLFQYKDIILSIAWTGLVLVGMVLQFKHQIGKPPFPPHRSLRGISNERTPLLSGGAIRENRLNT